MKATTKLLSLTTFVAAAMSFALPAWATDYTWTGGDRISGTYVLGYFEDADDDSSAMQLEEKMLDEDVLTSLYASHAVSSDSNSFASGSMPASSGTEILERVEITGSTSSTLNGALTLAPATNTSETVTVRQSAVATTSLSSGNSTEHYAVELQPLDKGRDGVGTLISSDDSGVSKETVSFLGNFDSVGYTDGSYGISTLSVGIDTFADDDSATYTWTGGGEDNNWTTTGNWAPSTEWVDYSDAVLPFDATTKSVTISGDIVAGTVTIANNYTFTLETDASLTMTKLVFDYDANSDPSLTIAGSVKLLTFWTGYGTKPGFFMEGSLTVEGSNVTFYNMSIDGCVVAVTEGGNVTFSGNTTVSNGSIIMVCEGGSLTFEGYVTSNNDVEIVVRDGGSLLIAEGATLCVNFYDALVICAGGSLTIAGTLDLLTGEGGFIYYGDGEWTVTIVEGGTILTVDGLDFWGGTRFLALEGTFYTNDLVWFEDAGSLILTNEFLKNKSDQGSVIVMEAGSIEFGTVTLNNDTENLDELIMSFISYDSEGYTLSDWTYVDGILSVTITATATPEPALFSLFFSVGALGLVATRRRRRVA